MLRTFALTLMLTLLIAYPAFAANPLAGSWRASSGYTVHIPEGPENFELVFEDYKGRKIPHRARWVTVGKQFTWIDSANHAHTATVDPKNPDRVCDVNSAYPTSRAYWYRMGGKK